MRCLNYKPVPVSMMLRLYKMDTLLYRDKGSCPDVPGEDHFMERFYTVYSNGPHLRFDARPSYYTGVPAVTTSAARVYFYQKWRSGEPVKNATGKK